MIKAIIGYNIEPGMTEIEYDHWLRNIHVPDLKKIPDLILPNFVKVSRLMSQMLQMQRKIMRI